MQPKSAMYLSHMLESSQAILQFVVERRAPDLSSDKLLRSAVYYQFAVIGEALTKLRAIDRETANRLTDASKIVGFRNQLIHGL